MRTKTCTKCGLDKEVNAENFYRQKQAKDGFRPDCKACRNKVNKRWSDQESVKIAKRQRSKEWREDNRDQHLESCREWYRKNKAEHQRQSLERHHKKYKHNPSYRVKRAIGSAVNKALKTEKTGSTWDYLPYTIEQLKEHLEAQFDEHMTWDNYGDYWHVDHIYPQSLLPYDSLEHENFQKCWALENLQPLEAIENIKKSNKII